MVLVENTICYKTQFWCFKRGKKRYDKEIICKYRVILKGKVDEWRYTK